MSRIFARSETKSPARLASADPPPTTRYRRRALLIAAAAACASLLAWQHADARHFRRRPIAAQIEAYVGSKPDSVTPIATWNVRVRKQLVKLYVLNLRVTSGDVAYFNIISAFEPYRVPLTMVGEAAALDQLVAAPKNQLMTILGNMQLDVIPGTFFISTISASPPTPTPQH